jgi:phage terminase large subunit-like protein
MKVISADAGKQYGLAPTLALIDELAWHPSDELYIALRTAMAEEARQAGRDQHSGRQRC